MIARWLLPCLLALSILLPGAAHAQDAGLIGPDVYPEGINPLTGLAPALPENLNRRPLVVKISNAPAGVRPQYGLTGADIVWEHIIDDGQTRFSAVFLGDDMPTVGPVRALSLLDFDLTRIYGAVAAYSQGSPGMIESVTSDSFMAHRSFGFGDTCPPRCDAPREGLDAENQSFSNTASLRQRATSLSLDTTPERIYGMAFSETPPANGVPVDGITVAYTGTSVQWLYQEFDGRWGRTQDGQGHFDALSGSHITAANVLILEAVHTEQTPGDPFYWGRGDFSFTVDLRGSGRVYLFRDGHYIEGEWRRGDGETATLTYFDKSGNVLPFKPGNTFVELVPSWGRGYQLTFLLANPPLATVIEDSVNLRVGPGTSYASRTAAYQGDTLQAIGRNTIGDWVQLKAGQDILWVSASELSLNVDIGQLPITRPAADG